MKRLFCSLLCIVVLISLVPHSIAIAQRSQDSSASKPTPRNANVYVYIQKNGNSIVAMASVIASPSLTVSTIIYIEQNVDGNWQAVSSNYGTFDVSATAPAQSDSSYRAYAICKTYDNQGNVVDTTVSYSTVVST